MDKLYSILTRDYGFGSRQIRILKALEDKELSARDLVKETRIPIGSIYKILNELIETKLIQKKKTPNTIYYIQDFSKNLINFADEQIYKNTNRRETLINSLKNNRRPTVLAFDDYLKFKLECQKQDPNPKHIYGLITDFRFPIFFFPEERYFEYKRAIKNYLGIPFSKQDEIKNSLNIRKYRELQEKGKETRWLINKKEFYTYLKLIETKFSKEEKQELLNRIKEATKADKVKLRLTNEKKDYQFIVTNNTLQFQLRNDPLFIGLIISDESTRDLYEKIFMNIWKKSSKFSSIIPKHL